MTNTVKGRVQKVDPNARDNYSSIVIRTDRDNRLRFNHNNGETWVSESAIGKLVKIRHENNKIQEIDIIEEDNEDAQSVQNSNAGMEGGSSNSSKSSSTTTLSKRQAGIIATASVKQARESVTVSYEEDMEKHIDRVKELSQAYNNIMKDRMRENTQ